MNQPGSGRPWAFSTAGWILGIVVGIALTGCSGCGSADPPVNPPDVGPTASPTALPNSGTPTTTPPITTGPVVKTPGKPPGKGDAPTVDPNTAKGPPLLPTVKPSAWTVARRLEHGDRVASISFSADGLLLASAGGNPRGDRPPVVKLWKAASGEPAGELQGHVGSVASVALSPDGKLAASAGGVLGQNSEVLLWNTVDRKETGRLPAVGSVSVVALGPGGDMLAVGGESRKVELYEFPSGKPFASLKGHSDFLSAAAFSLDGRFLATGSADRTIMVWNLAETREQNTIRGHGYLITSLAYSPDGSLIAAGAADHDVHLWDTSTYTLRGVVRPPMFGPQVLSVSFSPDGRLLAAAFSDHTVGLWDPSTRQPVATLTDHADFVTSVSFSPTHLATASEDGVILLYKTP